MKKYLIILFAVFTFSCSEILFDNTQPKDAVRLKAIPNDLWGFYKNGNDTLLISEFNFQLRSSLPVVNKIDFDLRNEDFQLMNKNNYFYLNIHKKEEDYSGWIVIRFNKNGKELKFNFIEEINDNMTFKNPVKIVRDEKGKVSAYILSSDSFAQYEEILNSTEPKTFLKR